MFIIEVNPKKINKFLKNSEKYGYKKVSENVYLKEYRIFGGTMEYSFTFDKIKGEYVFCVQLVGSSEKSDSIQKYRLKYLNDLWSSEIETLIRDIHFDLFKDKILILKEI